MARRQERIPEMYLIDPGRKQFKANLHAHSNLSDGERTPEELKEMYKNRGYSILSITDHEYPKSHADMSEEDFLMLTGYEAYIRSNPEGRYKIYEKEVHLNLFARDPRNETLICFNRPYIKYMSDEAVAELKRAGSEEQRVYSAEYVNMFIKTALENGYIVAYNHPYWSIENYSDVMAYEGIFSMEMCNYSSHLSSGLEYNGALYNSLLHSGKRLFCHSGDDNHNRSEEGEPDFDSFGAFTMVISDSLEYGQIFSAIEKGDMYSSTGPLIKCVSLEEGILHVETSPAEHIYVYNGSKKPYRVHRKSGEAPITSADFEVKDSILYLRVSVADANGNRADTRGYFRDELGM